MQQQAGAPQRRAAASVALSALEQQEAAGISRQVDSSDEEGACSADEVSDADEPPPPIPVGMKAADWDGHSRTSFDHYMYWASVNGAAAEWHTGVVARILRQNRRDHFTHDARLDRAEGVWGVMLDVASFHEGIWIPIESISDLHRRCAYAACSLNGCLRFADMLFASFTNRTSMAVETFFLAVPLGSACNQQTYELYPLFKPSR
eukprot:6203679-Pleurochrysis_carterae.AAC.2